MRRMPTPWVASVFAITMCIGLPSPAWAVSFTAVGEFSAISSHIMPIPAIGDTYEMIIEVDPTNDGISGTGFRFLGTGDLLINNMLVYNDISASILQTGSNAQSFQMALFIPTGGQFAAVFWVRRDYRLSKWSRHADRSSYNRRTRNSRRGL